MQDERERGMMVRDDGKVGNRRTPGNPLCEKEREMCVQFTFPSSRTIICSCPPFVFFFRAVTQRAERETHIHRRMEQQKGTHIHSKARREAIWKAFSPSILFPFAIPDRLSCSCKGIEVKADLLSKKEEN